MSRKKAILNILIYFLLPEIVMYFLVYCFQIDRRSNLDFFSLTIFLRVLTLILLLAINYGFIKNKLIQCFEKYDDTIKYAVFGLFISMGLMMVYGVILTALGVEPIKSKNQENIDEMLKNASLFSKMFLIVILAPIIEEIVFRASVLGVMIKDNISNNVFPYLLCALIFVLIHDYTIVTNFSTSSVIIFFSYFIPALGLVITYRISNNNLVSVIATHALYNGIVLMVGGL